MRIHNFAAGAVLSALATISFALPESVLTAKNVKILGAADQRSIAHFNVYLPLTHQDALEKLLSQQTDQTSANYHHWLTPAEFKKQFGPAPADMEKVRAALQAAGFTVVGEKTQNLEVEGPVSAVEHMFSTHLQQAQINGAHVKLSTGEGHLTMPERLAAAGAVIPEFSTHRMAHVHSARSARRVEDAIPFLRLSSLESLFYPNDLNEAYALPSFRGGLRLLGSGRHIQTSGSGARIGIVISSVISPDDLDATFNSSLDLGEGESLIQAYSSHSNLRVPTVTSRLVDGGSGPFDPNSDDAFEASLDTQMSLGTAPGAQETLYDIPDLTDSSITDGYNAVVEDNKVDIVSSSFGECELYYTAAYNGGTDYTGILQTFHALFQQGNAQGITFVASSGDNGAVPCLSVAFSNNPTNGTSFVAGVENPAGDPNVTAVGGTNLATSATPGADDATYFKENADFDPSLPAEYEVGPSTIVSVINNTWGSGGGYSKIFAKPAYQNLVDTGSTKYRSVPDLALMMGGCPGDADLNAQNCNDLPRSAAIIWIGGYPELLIGTSSSAPEIAGVLALAIELNGGRLGNVNPMIYGLSKMQTANPSVKALQFFHRNISGNNNFYKVKPGQTYSEVLGNGTLDVKNFLGLSLFYPFVPAAGAPNTASNP
jgi:subtilase family serine protease